MTTNVNPKAKKPSEVIALLKHFDELSTDKLAASSGIPKATLNNILRYLRMENLAHVSRWEWSTSKRLSKVYKWGHGINAERPSLDYKDRSKPIPVFKPKPDVASAWLFNPIEIN